MWPKPLHCTVALWCKPLHCGTLVQALLCCVVLCCVHLQAGEFWWKLALEATPALPQPPIQLSAPLGSTATHMLSVANPTATEVTFTSSSSSPDRFWLEPQAVRVSGSLGILSSPATF